MLRFSRYFLFLLCFAFSPSVLSLSLSLQANKTLLTTGDTLMLRAAVSDSVNAEPVDLYFSVQFPDSASHYFPNLQSLNPRHVVEPLLTNWSAIDMSPQPLLSFVVDKHFPKGLYHWRLLAVKAGEKVGDIRYWVTQTELSVEVASQTLTENRQPFPFVTIFKKPEQQTQLRQNLVKADNITDANSQAVNQQPQYFSSGTIDDNLNLSAFQHYLTGLFHIDSDPVLPEIIVADRIGIKVLDANNQAVNNAKIAIYTQDVNTPQIQGMTASDSVFHFYPTLDGVYSSTFTIVVSHSESEQIVQSQIDLDSLENQTTIDIHYPEALFQPVRYLDLMWVLDTTATLEQELRYLNQTLHSIMARVGQHFPELQVRYGLRIYRDQGDDYVVRDFPFTEDLHQFLAILSDQQSRGGGDYPEAMLPALASSLNATWSSQADAVRLLFLLTDAPPHDQDMDNLLTHINQARAQGIQINTIAASETEERAAYILRSIAALTQGRYIFLSDHQSGTQLQTEPNVLCYPVTALKHTIERVIISQVQGQRQAILPENLLAMSGDFEQGVCQVNASKLNTISVEE